MAQLIAKTILKFATESLEDAVSGRAILRRAGRRVEPGEAFTVDAATARRFLEDGSAMLEADARAADRHNMTPEDKLREAESEARAAGMDVSVTVGAGEARVVE